MIALKNRDNRSLTFAGIFTAAALSIQTLSGCTAVPRTTETVRMVSLAEKQKQGYWSIFVVSDRLLDVPILPDPVHNFIRICETSEDTPYATLHGVCLDRVTGKMPWLGDNGDGLFAIVKGDAFSYNEKDPFVATEIFCGSRVDVTRKLLVAMDAMNFINQQNLVYHGFDILSAGQNSNSVAYTLVRAMGCEFPDQNTTQLEPGNGRMLLPAGWRSAYEDHVFPSDDPNFLSWYAQKMSAELESHLNRIITGAAPPRSRSLFFDPAAPFEPYAPLLIPDAYQRWQAETQTPAPLNADHSPSVISADPSLSYAAEAGPS